MTKTAQNGKNVTIHYVGTLDDGTQFDNSRDREEPVTVTLGSGQLIEGFNNAIVGLTEGETTTFRVSPDEAYGEHHEDRVQELPRGIFPDEFELASGMTIPLQNDQGQNFLAVVNDFNDEVVTADFNHPLAGKDLTFTVEVLAVSDDEDAQETDS